MVVSDDEVVLLYLEIAELLVHLPLSHCICILKKTEQMFESEADNELGDFLNNMFVLYAYHPSNDFDEMHTKIRDIVYESELNYDLIFQVGVSILEETYLNHYIATQELSKDYNTLN
jgi:hypothetical protein